MNIMGRQQRRSVARIALSKAGQWARIGTWCGKRMIGLKVGQWLRLTATDRNSCELTS